MGRDKYPGVTIYPPTMKIKELRVDTSLGTDDLVPTSGKKIRVLGFVASQFIDSGSTIPTTLRSTLAFGDAHTGDAAKILAGWRQADVYDDSGVSVFNINILGDINEIIRLTNITHTGAVNSIISRAVIYYIEE